MTKSNPRSDELDDPLHVASEQTRQLVETRHLYRVEIEIPKHNRRQRLGFLQSWCHIHASEWAQLIVHHQLPGTRPRQLVRFCFTDVFEAENFQLNFGGRLSKASDAMGKMLRPRKHASDEEGQQY